MIGRSIQNFYLTITSATKPNFETNDVYLQIKFKQYF